VAGVDLTSYARFSDAFQLATACGSHAQPPLELRRLRAVGSLQSTIRLFIIAYHELSLCTVGRPSHFVCHHSNPLRHITHGLGSFLTYHNYVAAQATSSGLDNVDVHRSGTSCSEHHARLPMANVLVLGAPLWGQRQYRQLDTPASLVCQISRLRLSRDLHARHDPRRRPT
jgi:hypothetical protein